MPALSDIFPRPLVAVVIAYLCLSYALGSVFAERLAAWKHVPACKLKLTEANAQSDFTGLSEAERKRRLLQGLLRNVPGLSELPMIREIAPLLTIPKSTREPQDFASRCACLGDAAIAETRWDHMVWVATLRTYKTGGVSRFPGVMARLEKSGRCSAARTSS